MLGHSVSLAVAEILAMIERKMLKLSISLPANPNTLSDCTRSIICLTNPALDVILHDTAGRSSWCGGRLNMEWRVDTTGIGIGGWRSLVEVAAIIPKSQRSQLCRGAAKLNAILFLSPSTIFKSTLRVDCSLRSLSIAAL